MTNLVDLYLQYKKHLFPCNPVTRSVLRSCLKDRIDSYEAHIVYKYLAIEWVD